MINQLKFCMFKDFKEYTRTKKNVIFTVILLLICVMVFATTMFFPGLLEKLVDNAPDIISDIGSLQEMINHLFPLNLAGNMGILSSDIAVFYSVAVVLMTQSILPHEIKSGKWILPLGAGYSRNILVLSKCMIYALGAAFPVFVFYNLYYWSASGFLECDMGYDTGIINSLVLAFSIFSITIITILSSVVSRNSIVTAISIILTIMIAPDVLTNFAFGQYLPTHLLTFTYNSSSSYEQLIIPLIEMVMIIILFLILAMRKSSKIEVNR